MQRQRVVGDNSAQTNKAAAFGSNSFTNDDRHTTALISHGRGPQIAHAPW
jgi:hypothetical protein